MGRNRASSTLNAKFDPKGVFCNLPALTGDKITSKLDKNRGLVFTERKTSMPAAGVPNYTSSSSPISAGMGKINFKANKAHFKAINPLYYKDIRPNNKGGTMGVFK